MHSISDFVPYEENKHLIKDGEHWVLAWKKAYGWHFVQFGYVFGDDYIIAGVKA